MVRQHLAWTLIPLLIVAFCTIGPMAGANEAPDAGAGVSLGSVSGTPKGEAAVPVMLSPHPSETRIGGVAMTIAFESTDVSFERAEKGFLLDGVGGVVEAQETKDADNPAKSRLLVKAETKGEPRKSLPEDLILTLIFEVKPNATPKTVVPLKIEEVTVSDTGTPARVLNGSADRNGSIEIILPEEVPVMPCFFFTH